MTNDTVTCKNDGGHGVDATLSGVLILNDVIINTAGAHGAAIATDRGGGTITVSGGSATASGQDSPGIYSTGNITASDAVISATGAEAAVIEGANTITLTNTDLSGATGTRDRGLMIYQSMSGDAQGVQGVFTMTGGSFTWPSPSGPAFYVTNSTGIITLSDVKINNSSTVLVKAAADQWGNSGTNGGKVKFTADGEILTGNIVVDDISSVAVSLKNNSSFTGSINSANTAGSADLTLDETSTCTVTADSYINSLNDTGGISDSTVNNITGNGYNIYYDASLSANSILGNKTYSLNNGGELIPVNVNAADRQQKTAPDYWELEQNYPNPFNPSTSINYQIPAAAHVSLIVYNSLGREIAELVNSEKTAGKYTVSFRATNLSSGIYYYTLRAGKFLKTKKMILLK